MTHHGRTKRNVVVAAVAALMLAVSGLAQDSETVLHTFTGGDGVDGGNHLVADSAGNFYGTTFGGGSNSTECEVYTGFPGCGVVFELSPTKHGPWKEKVLHVFTGGKDGGVPTGGVILDSAGNLYGTTLFGGNQRPQNCQAVSIFAAGCGVVFKLTPTAHGPWAETVLYAFTGGADGSEPWGNPFLDSNGNLYGMTNIGGADSSCGPPPYGCGVVFKLTPAAEGPWTESVLYTFSGGADGAFPYGDGVTFDSQGNLYGVTYYGGDTSVSCFGTPGCGVVFQLAPSSSGPWTETVLHAFTDGTDGAIPLSAVILDSAGNVYGTTIDGGDTTGSNCLGGSGIPPGCGVVFELTQGTWEETVLYTFTGGSDGASPLTPVIFDSSGNLYGVTTNGGDFRGPTCHNGGCGVVFKLTPAGQGPWTESVLHAFTGAADGRTPQSNLLFDSAGNIYGMTDYGGDTSCNSPFGCGVVFELTP
jgi:uncharacterized repeat protein (TIGR03803 family)